MIIYQLPYFAVFSRIRAKSTLAVSCGGVGGEERPRLGGDRPVPDPAVGALGKALQLGLLVCETEQLPLQTCP